MLATDIGSFTDWNSSRVNGFSKGGVMSENRIQITPYEVGKYYMVPCVRGEWDRKVADWPVLGPLHDDTEHIGFETPHYHVDARFVADRHLFLMRGGKANVFVFPLHGPHEYEKQLYESTRPDLKHLGYRRRKCKRQWPDHPQTGEWQQSLEDAYQDVVLKAPICPHRGAPLDTLEMKDGCVLCPLHGLRFNLTTGCLVRRTQKGGHDV